MVSWNIILMQASPLSRNCKHRAIRGASLKGDLTYTYRTYYTLLIRGFKEAVSDVVLT